MFKKKRNRFLDKKLSKLSSLNPSLKTYDKLPPVIWSEIKQYFENFTYEELLAASKDKNIKRLGDIQFVSNIREENIDHYLFLPNGMSFYLADVSDYGMVSNNSIENWLQQVSWDVHNERFYFDSCVEWLTQVSYEVNNGPTKNVSFGGSTDFYEKFGWWPHIELDKDGENEKIPLLYTGQIIFNGELGYLFESHITRYEYTDGVEIYSSGDEETIINAPSEYVDYEFELGFAFIVPSLWKAPPWILEEKLPENIKAYYPSDFLIDDKLCGSYKSKGFSFPRMASGAEHFSILDEPYNNFFLQIPLFKPNELVSLGPNEFRSYEMSTYTICYNREYDFRAYFQLV